MHLGTSRWTYPLLSAAVCLAALLAPALAGKAAASVGFAIAAALVSGLVGHFVGSREDGLRALGSVDVLTGLFNRRYFESNFQREIAQAHRRGTPLALLLIDVDGLKNINDILGHGAGDAAICAVADALHHSLRASDLSARWGGDEFVVLAPDTGELAARALAERIGATVHLRSAARRPLGGAAPSLAPTVTVSIGVVTAGSDVPGQLRTDAMFAAADRALYTAKGIGPGRVQSATGEGKSVVRTVRPPLHLVAPAPRDPLAGVKRRTSG
jgi:diguanylate cyclase (GGDEF)-like protein